MPSYGKRRKGKQGGGRSAPSSTVTNIGSANNNNLTVSFADDEDGDARNELTVTETSNPVAPSSHELESNNDNTGTTTPGAEPDFESTGLKGSDEGDVQPDPFLVLTSEKRRGVYECDYCHADISQLPRIRCAVCPDFDLCLSCFITVDHKQALQRLKAQATAHQAVGATTTTTADDNSANGAVDSLSNIVASGVSAAALGHDDSHGYRVCDSTRYPLFPTQRNLSLKGVVQSLDDKLTAQLESQLDSVIADETKANTDSQVNSNDDDDAMDVDDSESNPPNENIDDSADKSGNATAASDIEPEKTSDAAAGDETKEKSEEDTPAVESFLLHDDPRNVWTVEEDLRLLDGIRTHGLGNWNDISESVSGYGSTGKTPKRCMERYLDDFLGRYGHILPPYTLLSPEDNNQVNLNTNSETDNDEKEASTATTPGLTPAAEAAGGESTDGTEIRASKRRAVLLRSPSSVSNISFSTRRKFKAAPTESLPGYDQVWPFPYVPDGVTIGQEVGREQTYKAEQTFVKMISQLDNQEQVEELRKEWVEAKLLKPGGPTVLPMRPEDVASLPGAELAGFMPRRGDFDIEWDNDAESIVADLEFLPREPTPDRELKLKVLSIYNAKLEEREKRKRFVLSRQLYDYRSIQTAEQKLPRDERDLIHRMRLFERFHTPAEHKQFIADLLKAKRLRKEIGKLQMYRRIGIRTLAEAEMYELDKSRRAFHKSTQQQKAAEAQKLSDVTSSGAEMSTVTKATDETSSSYLWKQYRTSDRKVRRSIARGEAPGFPTGDGAPEAALGVLSGDGNTHVECEKDGKEAAELPESMDVDVPVESPEDKTDRTQPTPTPAQMAGDALTSMPGFHLLSTREADLCRTLQLSPQQYQEIKGALLREALTQGLLDKGASSSAPHRSVVMIDAKRRGNVIDFMVQAGWISPKFARRSRESNKSVAIETP